MPQIEDLLKKPVRKETLSGAQVDEGLLKKIVSKMKSKFEVEDEKFRKSGAAEKLRKLVEEKPRFEIMKATPADLRKSEDAGQRRLGAIYGIIKYPFGIFTKIFNTAFGSKLNVTLESAGMKINAHQYLAMTVTAMVLTFLVSIVLLTPAYIFLELDPVMIFALALLFPILIFAYMLVVPGNRAAKRSAQIEKQLPFALRHMAVEIKAGVTLFKTMQSIAHSSYGLVSKGFQNVLSDIDKGMSTEEALEKWSRKAGSEGLRRALSHITRALRTGGSLSDIMITIAEDVTFERKTRITEYVSKLNLLSLFLMMTVIVLPVMLTILTAIGSSAVVKQFAGMFSVFSPVLLAIIYYILTPMFLMIFITVVKASDPG